ncbi:MAG TPA: GNAT family N-acetyltransferase [Jatrophihabitans sp.]|nr:GNAT family N-acetyltransferase [Jatrophihabitans sp.]
MADASVRPAAAKDAAEIGRIQVETWRTGYREILPQPVLDALSATDAAQAWSAAITAPPSARHHVLVALDGQWLVGFAAFGPAADLEDDDPEPATTAAVAPLLVEPRWGRRGHGSRLLAATVDHARADGMTRVVTWIPEADRPSREFLVSAGWAPDGLARALDTGAGELREVRLHTVLADGAG